MHYQLLYGCFLDLDAKISKTDGYSLIPIFWKNSKSRWTFEIVKCLHSSSLPIPSARHFLSLEKTSVHVQPFLTMNYCQKGRELLMDLKRSDFLPSYDDEGVRLLLSEMNDLHDKFAEIVSSTTDADVDPYSPAVKAALSYYHECLCRNRRYINRSVVHDIVLMMKAVNLTESFFLHNTCQLFNMATKLPYVQNCQN